MSVVPRCGRNLHALVVDRGDTRELCHVDERLRPCADICRRVAVAKGANPSKALPDGAGEFFFVISGDEGGVGMADVTIPTNPLAGQVRLELRIHDVVPESGRSIGAHP